VAGLVFTVAAVRLQLGENAAIAQARLASCTLAAGPACSDGRTALLSAAELHRPWAIGVTGFLITVLLTAMVALILRQRHRALLGEALRRSHQELLDILDHLPVGVLMLEGDSRITFRNRRFVTLFGFTEDEAPDADAWWRGMIPDPDRRAQARTRWSGLCGQALDGDGIIAPVELDIQSSRGVPLAVEMAGTISGRWSLITVRDVTDLKEAQARNERLLYYDALTELPNRLSLYDRLRESQRDTRPGRWCALLLVDIDNLKALNEAYGRDQGDLLLSLVAERLQAYAADRSGLARSSGNGFALLLAGLEGSSADVRARALEKAGEVQYALRALYWLDKTPYHASVSIGIVTYAGAGQDPEEIFTRAELALFRAQSAGPEAIRFYDGDLRAAAGARVALEQELRDGIRESQFELFYQPQVSGARITGAEALLRWRHPGKGLVPPAAFIPVAEDTGLIIPLGDWVLRTACVRLAAWARDAEFAALTVSVNVSARQFREEGFAPRVLDILRDTGAPAARLRLELTESLLLHDLEGTVEKMTQLRGQGVQFSLDDFGTGYSSLSYLRRLPLTELKIDQSFVRDVLIDENAAVIARTVISLGAGLGLQVLAEGVESAPQRDFLARNQCRLWQGYLFGRPMPVAEFEDLLRAGARTPG
jgi:diguanylate cyclase (GGDEF)-like protein